MSELIKQLVEEINQLNIERKGGVFLVVPKELEKYLGDIEVFATYGSVKRFFSEQYKNNPDNQTKYSLETRFCKIL